jgi:hypothetical protein
MEKKMEKKLFLLIFSAFACCNSIKINADSASDILIPTAVGAGIGGIAGGGRGAGYGALGGLAVGSILHASRGNGNNREDHYEKSQAREEERKNLYRQADRLEERIQDLEKKASDATIKEVQNLYRDLKDFKYDFAGYNGSKWRRYYKRLNTLERRFKKLYKKIIIIQ